MVKSLWLTGRAVVQEKKYCSKYMTAGFAHCAGALAGFAVAGFAVQLGTVATGIWLQEIKHILEYSKSRARNPTRVMLTILGIEEPIALLFSEILSAVREYW